MRTKQLFSATAVAACAAVLAMGVFSVSPAVAQNAPPGGSSWGVPDLKAVGIDFLLVKKYNATEGRVRITGTATNIHGGVFTGIAHAALYESQGTEWRRVGYQKIPAMNCGQVCVVSYERDWKKNAAAAPTYKLAIEVPWSATNDDPKNNEYLRSGQDINALFLVERANILPPKSPTWVLKQPSKRPKPGPVPK